MAVSIPRSLVEYILLGPTGDRRQLQDSPILGDVWIAFANEPGEPQEVLITPHTSQTAASVALQLDELIAKDRESRGRKQSAHIAYLQGIIAARLYFDELLRIVVPVTGWWNSPRNMKDLQIYLDLDAGLEKLGKVLDVVQTMLTHWSLPTSSRPQPLLSALDRYAALAGIILWASGESKHLGRSRSKPEVALATAIQQNKDPIRDALSAVLGSILATLSHEKEKPAPLAHQVSLNRRASMAISRSVSAVKADAVLRLFEISCSDIAWAVIDAGVQGNHKAFLDSQGKFRVKASFDFSNYRKIVSLDNLRIFDSDADPKLKKNRLAELLRDDLKNRLTNKQAEELLTNLAKDVKFKRPIHWEFVEPFIELKIDAPRGVSDHGTHVAGIIGARKPLNGEVPEEERSEYANGMCPDIQIYDFQVLAASEDIRDTEFAIIAALQYIRHMNERNDHITIHGANLSLSIPHDVRNYACGRTPVCTECGAPGRQRRRRRRRRRKLRLPELHYQRGIVRGIRRLQHHRPR